MPGNVDGNQVEGTTVDIQAAYLRFTPKRFKNGICMRVELYGCKSSKINDLIPATKLKQLTAVLWNSFSTNACIFFFTAFLANIRFEPCPS